jgi:hypothetical protein
MYTKYCTTKRGAEGRGLGHETQTPLGIHPRTFRPIFSFGKLMLHEMNVLGQITLNY